MFFGMCLGIVLCWIIFSSMHLSPHGSAILAFLFLVGLGLGGIGGILFAIFYMGKEEHWQCPKCGERYFKKKPRDPRPYELRGITCSSCGLPKWAPCDPERIFPAPGDMSIDAVTIDLNAPVEVIEKPSGLDLTDGLRKGLRLLDEILRTEPRDEKTIRVFQIHAWDDLSTAELDTQLGEILGELADDAEFWDPKYGGEIGDAQLEETLRSAVTQLEELGLDLAVFLPSIKNV